MLMLDVPVWLGPEIVVDTAVPEVWTVPPAITIVALPVPVGPAVDAAIPVPVPVFNTCPPVSVTWAFLAPLLLALTEMVLAAPVDVIVPPSMLTEASPPIAPLVTVTAEPEEVTELTLITLMLSSGLTGPTGVESDTPCVPETTVFGLFRLSAKPLEFV